MSDQSESEWLPLFEAVARLSAKAGSIANAKKYVAASLRDGKLTAYCEQSAFGVNAGGVHTEPPMISASNFGFRYARQIMKPPGQHNILDSSFWRHSYDWDGDVARWDWQAGLVVVSRPPPIRLSTEAQKGASPESIFGTRMVAYNVHIERIGVDKVAGSRKKVADGAASGRKPAAKWHEWVAELAAHVHINGIPDGDYTPYRLIEDLHNALALRGLEGLTYGTAQAAAEATIKRLREIPE